MKTIAVIVTYNRKAKLLACLKALAGQTAPCEILVVDNASTDGTSEAVSTSNLQPSTSNLQPVYYLNPGANLGGAGGFAFGIREAARRGADRIWIMDDDVLPRPDALEKLLAADAELKGGYGWLSSKCLGRDGKICPMNRQRVTPYGKVKVKGEGEEGGEDGKMIPAQMASFVSLFFPVDTVARFALPLAKFFIWCDDLEWTRRVSRKRHCYVVPASVVVHDIAGTAASDVATDVPERIPRYFYAFRNEFYTYRREGLRGLAYYFAKCAKHFLRVLVRAPDRRRERLSALLRGIRAGLSFHPKRERLIPKPTVVPFEMGANESLVPPDSTVSVVIPTYQAGAEFAELLRRLKAQRKIPGVEIVVVDSGSTDGTVAAARAAGAVVVEIPHESFAHSHARNVGVGKARGAYLIVMTQDALPPDDLWIVRMLQPVVRKLASAVVCRHDPRPNASAYGRCQATGVNVACIGDSDSLVALPVKGKVKELKHCAHLSNVACALARKTAIDYPYRGVFAEDFDLGLRLLKSGHRLAKLASVGVIHSHDRPAFYVFRRRIVSRTNEWSNSLLKSQRIESAEIAGRLLTGAMILSRFFVRLKTSPDVSAWTDRIPALVDEISARVRSEVGGSAPLSPGGLGDVALDGVIAEIGQTCGGRWEYDDRLVRMLLNRLQTSAAATVVEAAKERRVSFADELTAFMTCAFASAVGKIIADYVHWHPDDGTVLNDIALRCGKGV